MTGGAGLLVGGRYRLTKPIGHGGMGVVWRAYDQVLGRDVAVKEVVFPARIPPDEQRLACARSVQEARAAGLLNHPAVITVHDVVEHDGRPWIVMELFRGGSLADLIDEVGPLPPWRVAHIGLHVLDALSEAHAAGIVHRDVKPANVLVDDSRVVLTDFGAAAIQSDPALTSSGMFIGTPAYMAPERAQQVRASPISDLWSLGATLYAAVEGRPPFTGPDSLAVLSALLTTDPPPPRRAGPLVPILHGLMCRNMQLRMTAGQARELLSKAAASVQDLPPARTPTQPATHDKAGDLRADRNRLAHPLTEAVRPERSEIPPERPVQRPGTTGSDPAPSTGSARPNGLSPAQPLPGAHLASPSPSIPSDKAVYQSPMFVTVSIISAIVVILAAVGIYPIVHSSQNNMPGWSIKSYQLGDGSDSGNPLQSVSCPSRHVCVALDAGGNAFTYRHSGWTGPQAVDGQLQGNSAKTQVSCASARRCVGIDGLNGTYFSWDGVKWSSPKSIAPDGSTDLNGISCPNAKYCLAVGNGGGIWSYNGRFWEKVQPGFQFEPTEAGNLSAVSCTGINFCIMGSFIGIYFVLRNGRLSYGGDFPVAHARAITCLTPSYCWAAANTSGTVMQYDGSGWSADQGLDTQTINSISCWAVGRCVAVDEIGRYLFLNGASWSSPEGDRARAINSISCGAPKFCVSVGQEGATTKISG